jgi:hypothetical protein
MLTRRPRSRPRSLSALAFAGLVVATAAATLSLGCPGTLSLEEKQHLAYDCPDVPSVILARRCANAGCHDAAFAAGGLDLASPKLAQRLIGVPASGGAGALIDLRDPESSVLLTKLGDRPPFGARMPSGRPAIDPASYACVHAWVYAFVPVKTPFDAGSPFTDADAAMAIDAGDAADAAQSGDSAIDAIDAIDAVDASADDADATDAQDDAQDVATDSASGGAD